MTAKDKACKESFSTQSTGVSGQRFWAFVVSVVAVNLTMWFATKIKADPDLAANVVMWQCLVAGTLIVGRSFVHVSDAWLKGKKPGK